MPWRLRRSCYLAQLASRFVLRLVSQQCTQTPQNGAERPDPPICVHSCVPTSVHNSATVYTNASKWLQGAVFVNLCTLLRHRPSGDAHAAGAVTQPTTHTNSRSLRLRPAKGPVSTDKTHPYAADCGT